MIRTLALLAVLALVLVLVVSVTTPAHAVLDNFNRADNTDLGANWTPGYVNAAQIVSGAVRATTLGANSDEYYTGSVTNDQFATVTIKSHTGAAALYMCLRLRMATPPTVTYYDFCTTRNTGGPTSYIEKYVAGIQGALVSSSTETWAAGDTFTAKAQGTALTLLRNGVVVLSTTNGDIASGTVAFALHVAGGGNLANAEIEEIEIGTPTASTCCTRFPISWLMEEP